MEIIDILNRTTPAETLLLLKPSTGFRNLLKYTLMDQFLKENLALTRFDPKPAQGQSNFRYARVIRGPKFQQVKPKLHEMVFLFPFYRKPASNIVVKHLLQMGMQTARTEGKYKKMLRTDDPFMKPLFSDGFWVRTFGGTQLSKNGKAVQQKLVAGFNLLDQELQKLLKADSEKAGLILKKIGGNVLLMNSFKFDLIQIIGREISLLEEELEGDVSAVPS